MDYSLAIFNFMYLNSIYQTGEITEETYCSLRNKLVDSVIKTLSPLGNLVTEADQWGE